MNKADVQGGVRRAALCGNPNSGKTTLFNLLTGQRQHVGNWAGVTVEKKEGLLRCGEKDWLICDLPGIYSLSPYSMEETAAKEILLKENPELLINIVDGTNLERNLYLSVQLMAFRKPMILAVNMVDELECRKGHIDCGRLSATLGIPVIPISAKTGAGIKQLKSLMEFSDSFKITEEPDYDLATRNALTEITAVLSEYVDSRRCPVAFYAEKLLEGDESNVARLSLPKDAMQRIQTIADAYGDTEERLASARYRLVRRACEKAAVFPEGSELSDKIDKVLTGKYTSIPVFLAVLFCVFAGTFGTVGNSMKCVMEWGVQLLVQFAARLLEQVDSAEWCRSLILDAVIGGVGGILVFLPQIATLFLFLSLMEDSGYMARAAFIMDRLLRAMGLTGKSFIPMMMGFGCTTPAVMATRTLGGQRERSMTILLTPFISCGARLPIYALFSGAFFPECSGAVIFAVILLGMVVAVLCGIVLKKTASRGGASPFLLEMPPYRIPSLKSTLLHVWEKCKSFLVKAGTVIFLMNIVIWLLQSFSPEFLPVSDPSKSLFAQLGRWIAPIFRPLGFGFWQAADALLCGLAAKESVVSTLSVLYGAGTPAALEQSITGSFTPASALSFIVFSLLYAPCISAFASIARELGSFVKSFRNALFQTGVAYCAAFLVYTGARLLL